MSLYVFIPILTAFFIMASIYIFNDCFVLMEHALSKLGVTEVESCINFKLEKFFNYFLFFFLRNQFLVMRLIYFISIIDVSEGGGVPKWDFIHPDTPKPLRERLEKYRELAASFIYGIITAFGGEIVGDRLRELRLSEIKTIFMKIDHKGAIFYAVFIVDIKDHPSAVKKIFMKFYKKYYNEFDEVLMGITTPISTIERLRTAMSQFLVPYARKSRAFGARDTVHMLSSYVISLTITGLLAGLVWLYNHLFHLMETDPMKIVALSFFTLFIIPAIPIGFLTQFRKNAIIVSYLNSLSIVVGAALLWQDMLRSSAASILGEQPESIIILGAAGLVGIMLGTVLAFLSMMLASFFEHSRLTALRPLKLVPEVSVVGETKPQEKSEVPSVPAPLEMEEKEEEKEESEQIEAPSIDMGSIDIE